LWAWPCWSPSPGCALKLVPNSSLSGTRPMEDPPTIRPVVWSKAGTEDSSWQAAPSPLEREGCLHQQEWGQDLGKKPTEATTTKKRWGSSLDGDGYKIAGSSESFGTGGLDVYLLKATEQLVAPVAESTCFVSAFLLLLLIVGRTRSHHGENWPAQHDDVHQPAVRHLHGRWQRNLGTFVHGRPSWPRKSKKERDKPRTELPLWTAHPLDAQTRKRNSGDRAPESKFATL